MSAQQDDLHPSNVKGQFFVNRDCIGCDHCSTTAPAHFTPDDSLFAFVSRQPVTAAEIALCEEALDGCPVTAIGKRDENPLSESSFPARGDEQKASPAA